MLFQAPELFLFLWNSEHLRTWLIGSASHWWLRRLFFHIAHVLFDPCVFVVQGLILCPIHRWFVININQTSVWWLVCLCGHFSDLCILVTKDVCKDGKYSLLPPVLVNISSHNAPPCLYSRAKMMMMMFKPLNIELGTKIDYSAKGLRSIWRTNVPTYCQFPELSNKSRNYPSSIFHSFTQPWFLSDM